MLYSLRKLIDISQQAIADFLAVDQSLMSRIENSTRNLSTKGSKLLNKMTVLAASELPEAVPIEFERHAWKEFNRAHVQTLKRDISKHKLKILKLNKQLEDMRSRFATLDRTRRFYDRLSMDAEIIENALYASVVHRERLILFERWLAKHPTRQANVERELEVLEVMLKRDEKLLMVLEAELD